MTSSRAATPAQTPPILAKHEKRISVFSLVDRSLILCVDKAHLPAISLLILLTVPQRERAAR